MVEIHVTTSTKFAAKAQEIAQTLHWKTSEIARDPVLGNDTFFYLTTHSASVKAAFTRLEYCVKQLEEVGVEVIRQKIEIVIFDTKLGA